MNEIKLRKAIVIDNDDSNSPDKEHLSRIKVKILPELLGVDDDLLPWCRPFFQMGMSPNSITHNIPIIGSSIWMIFLDDYWKEGYYLTGRFVDGFFDFAKWEDLESLIQNDDIQAATYPNPRFFLLPDNSVLFYNTETKSKGIINHNGTYSVINGDGDWYTYFVDRTYTLYNEKGRIEIDPDGAYLFQNEKGLISMDKDGRMILENQTDSIVIALDGSVNIDAGSNDVNVSTSSGNVKIESGSGDVQLKTADSSIWQPCILSNCLFTGAPHGGSGGGITKLKG